jgi:hypothetical protein
MDHTVSAVFFAVGLFLGMLLLFEVGRRLRTKELRAHHENEPGLGEIEAAIFGLFGLLVAFTFSSAMQRFDAHRSLIAEETNTIGTAYLRLDLLPTDVQPVLRGLFRSYLEARLGVYRKLPDVQASNAEEARAKTIQGQIWSDAVAASALPGARPDAAKLLLPALNDMIDITTTRFMAARSHPPAIIFTLLFVLGLGCSLFAGYGAASSRRSWLHILGFSIVTAITIYVILDIEYPRQGLIRADTYDQVLIELQRDMK